MLPKIYFVIPCYNEEEMLPFTIQKMGEKLQSLIEKELISDKSKVVFVDDGSRDRTWDLIKSCCRG